MPIARSSGGDALLLVQNVKGAKNTYQVRIFDLGSGTVLYSNNFTSSTGTIVVGDFDSSSEGEEFIVQRNSPILVRPFGDQSETSIGAVSGVLADHVNVSTFRRTPGNSNTSNGSGGGSSCSAGFKSFGFGTLWKPAADAPDSRANKPVVLYQGGNKNGNRGSLKVFATNGAQIGSLGYKLGQDPSINGGSDHYFSGWTGGSSDTCSSFSAKAKQQNGNPNVVVEWKNNVCLGPINPVEDTAVLGGSISRL